MFGWVKRRNSSPVEDYEKTKVKGLIKKAYKDNYGSWLTYGGMYPGLGINLVLFTIATIPFNIFLWVTAIAMEETVLRCESVHFAVFMYIELCAAYGFLYYRKNIDKIYLYTNAAQTPDQILNKTSYQCTGGHGVSCGCSKAGLFCSTLCCSCQGTNGVAVIEQDDREGPFKSSHTPVAPSLPGMLIFPILPGLLRWTLGELCTAGMREMAKGFYDYEETLDEECRTFISDTINVANWRKKTTHAVFVGFVMMTCFSLTIFRPAFSYYFGDGDNIDGVLRLLPVPLWTPFSKTGTWYITLIFFILEDIVSYITPGMVFGCTLFVVCTCEDLGAQFAILGLTLKSVRKRAKCLNMPRDEAIKLCFRHSIRHHQTLLRFSKNLEAVVNLPGFGLLFGSTILMCLSGFIFVSKEVSLISKAVFCLFLLSELSIIFIFCWYGEYVQQTSTQIRDMVYSSEWVEDMKTMKSYVLIIQARTIRPTKLNFGGFMYASLETYSNICSSAFSYFNLLLAVNNN